MSNWQIGESGTTVALDDQGRGEVTFTVTNGGPDQDRAVLTVAALDGAADSWFSVEEPQRAVPPGESAAYLCRIRVPPGTAAGTYALQAVAYSADRDPGETSTKSKRVTMEVKPSEPPPDGLPPWLPIAIVAAVVLVVAVVLWLVLRGDGGLENTSPPTIDGDPRVLEPLTADPGEWSQEELEFTFQWQRCDAGGQGCADIAGVTLPSYVPGNDDLGARLRVGVTATAGEAQADAVSEPTQPVEPAPAGDVNVPGVVGFTRSGALSALAPDFQVKVLGGTDVLGSCDPLVIDQTPEGGTSVSRGEQVVIATEPARPVPFCLRFEDPILEPPFILPDDPPFTFPEDMFPGP